VSVSGTEIGKGMSLLIRLLVRSAGLTLLVNCHLFIITSSVTSSPILPGAHLLLHNCFKPIDTLLTTDAAYTVLE
jgi:hypothetical protein